MDKFRIERELNHTYLVLDFTTDEGDYRERMLRENSISGLLPVKKRFINALSEDFIDVTGLQSLEDMFFVKDMQKADINRLAESIKRVGDAAAECFLDEENILLDPKFIFYDIAKDSYRFVCYPLNGQSQRPNDNIKTLLLFLMQHIENDDELIKRVYSAYGYSEAGRLTFASLYELLAEKPGLNEVMTDRITEEPDETPEPESAPSVREFPRFYLPSFKEWVALLMCSLGLGLIGFEVYMSMMV